jgi:hypothetical protein
MMNNFELPLNNEPSTPAEPRGFDESQSARTPIIEINHRGQKVIAPHLEITDTRLRTSTAMIAPDELVIVNPHGEEERSIPFMVYLQCMGFASYADYEDYCFDHQGETQENIFRSAQREAIEWRLHRADELEREREARADRSREQQQISKYEHSLIWCKMINNLGLSELSAVPGSEVDDSLCGIDEYLKIDLSELEPGNDEVRYIGIQRSFNDKLTQVQLDPIRHLPEMPTIGAIYRVFIRDRAEDYKVHDAVIEARAKKLREEAGAQGQDVNEYIAQQAKKKNIDVKTYMLQRLERVPIQNFLPHGELQEIAWVKEVIEKTLYQLETYRVSAQGWDYDCLLKDITALKKILLVLEDFKITVELQQKKEAPTHE